MSYLVTIGGIDIASRMHVLLHHIDKTCFFGYTLPSRPSIRNKMGTFIVVVLVKVLCLSLVTPCTM